MSSLPVRSRSLRWGALAVLGLGAGYGALVAWAWTRYGHPRTASADNADGLLDAFMPAFEVSERHSIQVNAPAALVLATAKEMKLAQSPLIRAIFRARELVLRATPESTVRPEGLLAQTQSLGWRVLADRPGQVVVGAVTQPWLANVVFRGVPANQFAAFSEPGFVKIVWTIRADETGPDQTRFVTETRVSTTDARSRARFRWYWARFSPGIWLIRSLMLGPLKREAERQHRAAH